MTEIVIPVEAIETAARAAVEDATTPGAREWNRVAPWTRDIARSQARAALTAAAPLIVAANQPEPNRDLLPIVNSVLSIRETVEDHLSHVVYIATSSEPEECIDECPACMAFEELDGLLPNLESFVAAQVTAARADALREAAAEVHREQLWQLEIQTRGLAHFNNNPVERFGVVEEILTDRAEAGRG